ncbi:hypothetical protein EG68_02033 [Paragonimus skrjabini miyazakii]|uniref:G-protein coupled receptors family 1 profile domain-containing protein n=1 Tax=Paragonimus skrjabini miyazakii TaxID=59628 RepID=A0A8S9ZB38_9TREM|nr:hypothetical protein EG68_02033 [Paragonimus skrjabini miyazakii]
MLIWLVSICVGDFAILILEGIWMLLKVWFGYDIRDINNVTCVLHTSFSNYMFYWSAYMQSMLSMQRAYLIFRPIRARSNGPSMTSVLIMWTTISILLVIPMLPYPLFWRVIDGDCDPLVNDLFYVTTLNDFIIWGLIPLFGMTSATVIICWNIFRIRRSFTIPSSRISASTSAPTVTMIRQPNSVGSTKLSYLIVPAGVCETDELQAVGRKQKLSANQAREKMISMLMQRRMKSQSIFANQSPFRGLVARRAQSSDVLHIHDQQQQTVFNVRTSSSNQGQRHGATDNAGHVTRLLICMNIWYMISTYPLMIYLMSLNFILSYVDRDVHKFMYYLSRSLCFLNACSNWIFYCASGRLFRQRIRQIIRRFLHRLHIHSTSHSSGHVEHTYPGRNQALSVHILKNKLPNFDTYHSRFSYSPNKRIGGLSATRQIHSTDNVHIYAGSVEHTSLRKESKWKRILTSGFCMKLQICSPALKCKCICVSPFRRHYTRSSIEQQTSPLGSQKLSNGQLANGSSRRIFQCDVCCTGFCCWKFWWYGFKGGRMTERQTKDLQPQSLVRSSSSSSYFQSEVLRRHSQLQGHGLLTHTKPVERSHEMISMTSTGRVDVRSKQLHSESSQPYTGLHPTSSHSHSDCSRLGRMEASSCVEFNRSKKLPFGSQPMMDRISEQLYTAGRNTSCYCYISSRGKRQYHYHYCRLHQNYHRQHDLTNLPGHIYAVKSVDRLGMVNSDNLGHSHHI